MDDDGGKESFESTRRNEFKVRRSSLGDDPRRPFPWFWVEESCIPCEYCVAGPPPKVLLPLLLLLLL